MSFYRTLIFIGALSFIIILAWWIESDPDTGRGKDEPVLKKSKPILTALAEKIIPKTLESDARSPHSENFFTVHRIALRDIERGGIGYGKGYGSLDILFGMAQLNKVIPLLDFRGHHIHNDRYAVNAGLIVRYQYNKDCVVWGANVYYDWRESCRNFNQLGIGFEMLGRRWDLRLNEYIPIGSTCQTKKCVFDNFQDGFFMIFKRKECSFWGVNAEVGYYPVREADFSLYTAVAPYYLTGHMKRNIWGARMRIRPQYKDVLGLEFSVSTDNFWHTKIQGEVILALPLYKLYSKHRRSCLPKQDIYQPVQRFEIIPLHKHKSLEKNF